MRRNFESLNFERPQEAPTRHSLSYKDTDEDEFVDELSQFVPSSPTRLIRNQKACNPNNRLPSSCFRRNLTTSPHTFRKRFSWFLAVFLIVCLIAVVLFNFISMGKLQNVCLEQNNAEPVSNSQLMVNTYYYFNICLWSLLLYSYNVTTTPRQEGRIF